jgi:hypothetical protein
MIVIELSLLESLSISYQVLHALNDEGVDVIWSATNNDDPITTRMHFAAVINYNSNGGRQSSKAISTVVDALDATDIELVHLETRNAADGNDAHRYVYISFFRKNTKKKL